MDGTGSGKPASADTLTDQLRGWYDHSPTAQRAYAWLRADIDAVMAQARPKIEEFWQQIGPMIDPPSKEAADSPQDRGAGAAGAPADASSGGASDAGSRPS